MMTIDLVAPGTPAFPPQRMEVGLGGNEATLVSWWRTLCARGIRARVFLAGATTEPTEGWHALRSWAAISRADPPDVLIAWRDAEVLRRAPVRAVRLLYIGDRVTPGLDGRPVDCDLAFVGSRAAHQRYRDKVRPTHGFVVHSCGHAVNDDLAAGIERRRWQCVHASAPYRGLGPLLELWPRILRQAPLATLVVMGGYRLWGYDPIPARQLSVRDVPRLGNPPAGVRHLGEVSRMDYLRELASSQIMLYPTNYEEMCCITALEAAACGTVPIVSDRAALRERVSGGQAGVLVSGDVRDRRTRDRFADLAADLLHDPVRLERLGARARHAAERHTIDSVLDHLLRRIAECA
jgi:glycosyltransferase involved in cell wall biosynthesis